MNTTLLVATIAAVLGVVALTGAFGGNFFKKAKTGDEPSKKMAPGQDSGTGDRRNVALEDTSDSLPHPIRG